MPYRDPEDVPDWYDEALTLRRVRTRLRGELAQLRNNHPGDPEDGEDIDRIERQLENLEELL